MSSSKRALNRPKKRTLVRWDDNLNELLLLTVQSVCNNQSIKIPWSEVASTMKNNVTEGAIVQHLAKLRTRRVDAGKEVPPPLRRGGVGSSNKSSGNVPTRTASGAKRNLRAPLSAGSEEDEGLEMNFHDDTSSDEDYIDKGRRRSRPKKQLHKPQPREVIPIKSEDEDMDGSNDGFGELLVPGAEFLQYPNEQEPHSEPTSSPVSDNATSKLVTLRYRQPVGNMFSGFPSTKLLINSYWNLTSLGENQDFHNIPYAGYQHPAYYHSTDDSVGGVLYGDNYQFLHGNYIEPNEDLIMETQDNLVTKIE